MRDFSRKGDERFLTNFLLMGDFSRKGDFSTMRDFSMMRDSITLPRKNFCIRKRYFKGRRIKFKVYLLTSRWQGCFGPNGEIIEILAKTV